MDLVDEPKSLLLLFRSQVLAITQQLEEITHRPELVGHLLDALNKDVVVSAHDRHKAAVRDLAQVQANE